MGSLAISYPSLTGDTVENQIFSIKSYLYQLTDQLNLADWSAQKVLEDIEQAIDFEPSGSGSEVETEQKLSEYASIKSLIIKTADYASANSEEFKLSLRSDYVAISDFGEYFETATVDINGNSVGITQLYSYTAGIRNDMNDVNINSSTYIKTGLLYYDGVLPIYGVGVGDVATTVDANGETVLDRSNLLATFTASEIAFWSNGNKLAYITPTAVYFPAAHITGGSISIGSRFSVNSSGTLTATNANISGSITATSLDVSNAYISGDISASNISGGTLDCDNIYIRGLNVTDAMIDSLSCSKLYGTLASGRFAASTIGANCLSGGSCGNYITFNNMYHGGGTLASGLYVASASGNYAQITTNLSSPAFRASGGSGSSVTPIYNMIRAGVWWAQNEGSDARIKHAIEEMDDRYDAFFDGLRPTRFIYDEDTSGKYRLGFIAQEVRSSLENAGLTMMDFGALQLENEGKYNERYYLSKDGMIALNTWEIQKLKARVAALERGNNG